MNDATARDANALEDFEADVAGSQNLTMYSMTPLATAVVAALSPTGSAVAQEDEEGGLEEIIVTATKRSLDLQNVGQAITAFSTADLEKMGIKTMEEAVRALPSVVLTAVRPGRNDLMMRGMSEDTFNYYVDGQVSVYLDEFPMTTSSQQVSPRAIDMERFETLPGPQGTLFGASSQTGTMRMITNKPDPRAVSGQVEVSYGSTSGGDGSYDVNGFFNMPIIDDVLAVRIVGYTSHDGGYVDNVLGTSFSGNYDNSDVVDKNFNEYDTDGGRIAVMWNMTENWSLLASYLEENTELNGSWESDPALGRNKIIRFYDEFRTDDWWAAGLTLSGDMGFATISATYTKFDRQIIYAWDNMSYSQWHNSYYGYGLYDTDYNKSLLFNDQPQERETAEIRIVSQSDSRLQWMAGVYWEDVWDYWYYGNRTENFTTTYAWYYANYYACYYNYYNIGSVSCPLPDSNNEWYVNILDRSVQQTAVFAELSYDLTDSFTVIGGMRWSEFERDTFQQDLWPPDLAPWGGQEENGVTESDGKTDDTLYKLSFQYQIDDERMVYALWSQGFRLGGPNSSRAYNFSPDIPEEFGPDFVDNYELGIKSTWLDNTLQVNAQVFLMQWDDMQVYTGGEGLPWWVAGTVNAGSAESKGFEVDVRWRPTDNLELRASGLIGEAEFTETIDIDGDLYRDGMPMRGAPEKKAYASINYDIPDILGGDAWLWYDVSYQSETWSRTSHIIDNNPNGRVPSQSISNFQTGLYLPNEWSVTIAIDNVWDQETYYYVETGNNYAGEWFGNFSQERNVRTLSRPRTTWLTVRKHFGGGS